MTRRRRPARAPRPRGPRRARPRTDATGATGATESAPVADEPILGRVLKIDGIASVVDCGEAGHDFSGCQDTIMHALPTWFAARLR